MLSTSIRGYQCVCYQHVPFRIVYIFIIISFLLLLSRSCNCGHFCVVIDNIAPLQIVSWEQSMKRRSPSLFFRGFRNVLQIHVLKNTVRNCSRQRNFDCIILSPQPLPKVSQQADFSRTFRMSLGVSFSQWIFMAHHYFFSFFLTFFLSFC